MANVKKMKIVDGKLTVIEMQDREEVVKTINSIFDEIDDLKTQNALLRKELAKPKDEQLLKLKLQLEETKAELSKVKSDALYIFSEKDKAVIHDFWLEHRDKCPVEGKNMAFVVWGTGIGDCVEYGCRVCGDVVDLTDTSRW